MLGRLDAGLGEVLHALARTVRPLALADVVLLDLGQETQQEGARQQDYGVEVYLI